MASTRKAATEEAQDEPATNVKALAEELVTVARMKTVISPLITAMKKQVEAWDREFQETRKKRPIYWETKKAIGPLVAMNAAINKYYDTMSEELVRQIGEVAVEEYRAGVRARKQERARKRRAA